MHRLLHRALAALAACHLVATVVEAAYEGEVVACQYSAAGGEGESSAEPQKRQYAPDREVDVLHLTIDVTPDFDSRTVTGETTLRFVPIGHPLEELRLDAVDLSVPSVKASVKIAGYQVTEAEIVITFAEPIPVGVAAEVTIAHAAEPKEKGMYFRTPEMGYLEEDLHLFTQGEMHEHPHWFPSFDYPNERFSSEVICRVSPDLVVLSNGRLVSEEVDPATGLKASRWVQEKPHVNYLIALVAGRMKSIEDRHRDISLTFYTPASQIDQAANSFEETTAMMAFFEAEIGVPYPWVDYKQVAVDGFPWGGMENTTLTILTTRTLFTDATGNIRSGKNRNLIAHELAHQWFGDYLTCKDWSHIWLNEGFATYYAHLFEGHAVGRDQLLYLVYKDARGIFEHKDSRPIVYRGYGDAEDQFDYRAYPKGGWLLRMLRAQLGDELFRRCITTYVERHALNSVVTQDLNAVIEELSGSSYDQFFDQWAYHGRQPELKVKYSWDEKEKLAKVSVTQTQALSDSVLLFRLSTKIGFKTASGAASYRDIEMVDRHHDFYVKLDGKPDVVRFDPEYGLLAKVEFDKPTDMLYTQLEDGADVIGRLLAVAALKSKQDAKTVEKLKAALNRDAFYGVRLEASQALREIHTPAAYRALAASMAQEDARVRRQVVADVGGFFRHGSLEKTMQVLEEEENPAIAAQAIRNLGRHASVKQTRKMLVDYLKSNSYRNELAVAAIAAIREQDDPYFADPLRRVLASRRKNFTSRGFSRGLKTLAYIARNEEDREGEREFLSGYVNDASGATRIAAIEALGALRDPRAIPVVSSFAGGGRVKDATQRAADAALRKLRDTRQVPVELSALRDDLLELREENEQLREDLEDLTKRFEAREAGAEEPESEDGKPEEEKPDEGEAGGR